MVSAARATVLTAMGLFGSFLTFLKRAPAAGTVQAQCYTAGDCSWCPDVTGCGAVEALAAKAPGTSRFTGGDLVWQLDPEKCVQCGQCANNCVLGLSAVKCVHSYAICGYCRLCFGFFIQGARDLDEGAENQTCPNAALARRFVEEPYYEYTVIEESCVGCGKCVKGCNTFGNGSLFLQVRHDRCKNCNECSIARDCPSDAYSRVPGSSPYLLRKAAKTV